MNKNKEISLLKEISELKSTIQKLEAKIDLVKKWIYLNCADVLSQEIKDALSFAELSRSSTFQKEIGIVKYKHANATVPCAETSNFTAGSAIEKTSIDNNSFTCCFNKCSKTYLSSDALQNHLRKCHEEDGYEKSYIDIKDEYAEDDKCDVDPLGGLSPFSSSNFENMDYCTETESPEDTNTLDSGPQISINSNFATTNQISSRKIACSEILNKFNITKTLAIVLQDIKADINYQRPRVDNEGADAEAYQDDVLEKDQERSKRYKLQKSSESETSSKVVTSLRKDNYKCKKCKKCFSREIFLRNHENRTHNIIRPFRCHFNGCGRAYINRRTFREHMVAAHPGYDGLLKAKVIEKNFKCCFNQCNRVYGTKNALNNHQREKNHRVKDSQSQREEDKINNRDTFKCTFDGCIRVYWSHKALKSHQSEANHKEGHEKVVNGSNNAFKCLFNGCGRVYFTEGGIKNHWREVKHKTGGYETCLACGNCKKTFSTQEKVNEHISQNFCFNCNICEQKFNAQYVYAKHMEKHSCGSLLSCNYINCKQVFHSAKLLYLHRRKQSHFLGSEAVSNNNKDTAINESGSEKEDDDEFYNASSGVSSVLTCPTCKMCCPTRELLNDHILNLCFSCKGCWKPFSLKSQLDGHAINCNVQPKKSKTEKKKRTKSFHCQLCPTTYSELKDFENHMAEHEVKIFRCGHEGCKKKFKTEEEIGEHEKQVHCQTCYKSFVLLPNFVVHNDKMHGGLASPLTFEQLSSRSKSNEKNSDSKLGVGYECVKCKRIFESVRSLKSHLESGCIECKICGKTWHSKAQLENHVRRTHKGLESERAFLCNICGTSFTTRASFNYHINAKHTTERKTFRCTTCNKTFISNRSYLKHAKTHDPGYSRKQCALCGFDFANDQILKNHIRAIHENQRPYPCHLCDKRFKTNTSRNYHVKTHDNPNGRKRSLNKDVDDFVAACKRRNLK